jgi:hypothetical protein
MNRYKCRVSIISFTVASVSNKFDTMVEDIRGVVLYTWKRALGRDQENLFPYYFRTEIDTGIVKTVGSPSLVCLTMFLSYSASYLEDILVGEEPMRSLLILLLCASGSNQWQLIFPLIASLENIWIVTRKYTHPVPPKQCVAEKNCYRRKLFVLERQLREDC